MPLGMEVGLGPGHIVLDEDLASPPKGAHPSFRPMSVVAKRLDGSRCHLAGSSCLGPGDIVLDGDSAPLKGAQPLDPAIGLRSCACHELAPSNFQARLRYASVCYMCDCDLCRLCNAELFVSSVT